MCACLCAREHSASIFECLRCQLKEEMMLRPPVMLIGVSIVWKSTVETTIIAMFFILPAIFAVSADVRFTISTNEHCQRRETVSEQ